MGKEKRNFLLLRSILILIVSFPIFSSCTGDYPTVKFKLFVTDETGNPIDNATVHVSYFVNWDVSGKKGGGRVVRTRGKTNKEGEYTYRSISPFFRRRNVSVAKDGYYPAGPDGFSASKYKEFHLVLREIKDPIPMYSAEVYVPIPDLDKEVGFDLVEADLVAPYGKGKVNDFIFKVKKEFKNRDDYKGELTLTFSNKYDGIYPYPVEKNSDSQLILPNLAPESGYNDNLFKYDYEDSVKRKRFSNRDENQHYYFRIRSVEKDGKLVKAMYGKIQGEIRLGNLYHIVKLDQGKLPSVSFWYFLNPDGTRNTEFNPYSNLFNKPDNEGNFDKSSTASVGFRNMSLLRKRHQIPKELKSFIN